MATLPQIIEEDVEAMNEALARLVKASRCTLALVTDKAGFVLSKQGDVETFDTTTLGALAANTYAATEGMAGLLGETSFSSLYQQGARLSLLVNSVDVFSLLVVIFKAEISVGAVKYYAASAMRDLSGLMQKAHERAPDKGLDLATLNLVDISPLFRAKAQ